MAKIIDCFTFFNELKVLDLRLNELKDVVDHFILVEATKTHSGKSKRLYFDEIKSKYKDYPIIHVIVDDMPEGNCAWNREQYQRRSIIKGLKDLVLDDKDIIVLTDADEIPDPDTISNIAKQGLVDFAALEMDHYYYNLRCKWQDKWTPHPKIFNYSYFKKVGDFNTMRCHPYKICIPKGGWHFSYFGDANFIINKIESFAHQELNNEQYKNREKIQKHIDGRTSYHNADSKSIDIDPYKNDYLPKNWKILMNWKVFI